MKRRMFWPVDASERTHTKVRDRKPASHGRGLDRRVAAAVPVPRTSPAELFDARSAKTRATKSAAILGARASGPRCVSEDGHHDSSGSADAPVRLERVAMVV
eukprot:Amastigsp_a851392_4.p3 type:complete len:102 gc:universal Amastigsp_a851392_4:1-306(+)